MQKCETPSCTNSHLNPIFVGYCEISFVLKNFTVSLSNERESSLVFCRREIEAKEVFIVLLTLMTKT